MCDPVSYRSLIEADLTVIFCFLSRTGSDQHLLVTRSGSDVPEPAYRGRRSETEPGPGCGAATPQDRDQQDVSMATLGFL